MDLHDCVVLITGASGGLGAVTASMLASHVVHVAVTHLGHREEAVDLCQQIEATGRKAFLVHLDQTDPAPCSAAIEATVQAFGRLDILINNAAWNDSVPLADLDSLTPEVWERAVNTNLRGLFLMTRAAVSYLKRQDQGRVLNVAGTPGVGHPLLALAPSITVNCVAPGLMEGTRMFARVPPARVAAVKEQTALKRTTNPEDVEGEPTPLGRLLQLPPLLRFRQPATYDSSARFCLVPNLPRDRAGAQASTDCVWRPVRRLRLSKRWHLLEGLG